MRIGVRGLLIHVKRLLELGDRRFQRRQFLPCACQHRRLHIELFARYQVHACQSCRYGGVEIIAQVRVDLTESGRQAFRYLGDQRIEGFGINHFSHRPIGTRALPILVV